MRIPGGAYAPFGLSVCVVLVAISGPAEYLTDKWKAEEIIVPPFAFSVEFFIPDGHAFV
jgi:hypothetical protein